MTLRPTTYTRRPLRLRDKPMSGDVADAIMAIVGGSEATMPVAIAKSEIVEKLIEIAQTDEGGVYNAPTGPAANAMMREFGYIVTKTATFQSGYKRYEELAGRAVVPVVDYFFTVIYGGGEVVDVLDAMTDFEIQQSLPRRRSRVKSDDGEWRRDEETGEVLIFGELAGIVVFPAGSRHTLLWRWLERRANATVGQVNSTVASINHAAPGDPRLAGAMAIAGALGPMIQRAGLMPPAPAATPVLPPSPDEEPAS